MRLQISRGGRVFLVVVLVVTLLSLFGRDRQKPMGKFDMEELSETIENTVIVAMAALLHEGGHILAAWTVGVPVGRLRLDLFGARMSLSGLLSYRREFFIAAAGPLSNLISSALAFPVWHHAGKPTDGGITLFLVASFGLAVINLLPVRSLDGGRMLRCLLAHTISERAADGILTVTTAFFLGTLWLLSVYALLRIGEMMTLFAFSLSLLIRMMGDE